MEHNLRKKLKLTLIIATFLALITLFFFKAFALGLALGEIGVFAYIFLLIKANDYLFSKENKRFSSFLMLAISLKMLALMLPLLIAILFFEIATFFGVLGTIFIFKFILILPI